MEVELNKCEGEILKFFLAKEESEKKEGASSYEIWKQIPGYTYAHVNSMVKRLHLKGLLSFKNSTESKGIPKKNYMLIEDKAKKVLNEAM